MWSVGQTLWDKEKNELVLYLGVAMFSTKTAKNILKRNLPENLKKKPLFSIMMIRRRNGKVEFVEDFRKYTHIYDTKRNEIATGKHTLKDFTSVF